MMAELIGELIFDFIGEIFQSFIQNKKRSRSVRIIVFSIVWLLVISVLIAMTILSWQHEAVSVLVIIDIGFIILYFYSVYKLMKE